MTSPPRSGAEPLKSAQRQGPKRIKVFWFFFSKKNKDFFLKKEAKTFIR
jgi:hypothetical protein